MRIRFDMSRNPQSIAYADSMNAALVAGLVAAGARSEDLVGAGSRPWTFACEGRSGSKGIAKIFSVSVSTPDPELGSALQRLDAGQIRCASSNGDRIDLKGAKRSVLDAGNARIGQLMVCFASPLLIPLRKGAGKAYAEDLNEVDLDAALRVGLERRAGRVLDLRFHVDPLTRLTDVRKRVVPLRKSPKGPIRVPALSFPMTISGRPEDVEFAFLAGLGAKTHAGFGCPIFMK